MISPHKFTPTSLRSATPLCEASSFCGALQKPPSCGCSAPFGSSTTFPLPHLYLWGKGSLTPFGVVPCSRHSGCGGGAAHHLLTHTPRVMTFGHHSLRERLFRARLGGLARKDTLTDKIYTFATIYTGAHVHNTHTKKFRKMHISS